MSGVFAGYTQPLEQSYDYFNGMFGNILTQSNLKSTDPSADGRPKVSEVNGNWDYFG